eukprot:9983883-Alexandrium_andersonii.AAC.1
MLRQSACTRGSRAGRHQCAEPSRASLRPHPLAHLLHELLRQRDLGRLRPHSVELALLERLDALGDPLDDQLRPALGDRLLLP